MRRLILILLGIALIAAAVWFFLIRPRSGIAESGQSTSPVLVDILLPQNGSSVNQGDTLSVLAQAWSPSPLAALQLWVDGEMVAVANVDTETMPFKASWDWVAGGPGVHSLLVKAMDTEGNEGQSLGLLINVNAGGVSEVLAGGGQSLEDIGGQLGVPVSDLQSLNPGLDPQLPLQDGQPVILPPSPITEEGQQGVEAPNGPELVIKWQFTPLDKVDNSYCYQSLGGDSWQKIPADPFSFFPGDEWLQSYLPTGQQLELMMECWGWQGDTLKYLGEGQTNLDYAQIPEELIIAGAGFQMDGLPEQKPLGGGGGQLGDLQVPPPFALREAESVDDCAAHMSGQYYFCEFMNSQVKWDYALVWEWQPKFCWPGTDCPWADHVDGYWVYEMDTSLQNPLWIKDIPNYSEHMAPVPLPWGAKCYGVVAYANLLTSEGFKTKTSDFATYCPGEPPQPEKVVLTPSDWLSSEGMWINEGCDNWADAFRLKPTGTQVVAGFFLFADDEYCDIKQGSGTAAIAFNNIGIMLPPEAVVQRATLRFKQVGVKYDGPFDVALGNFSPPSCATRVGKAKSDWTALSSGHFINPDTLGPYYSPYTSIGWDLSPDVTSTVLGWMDNPSSNHGFVLIADPADLVNNYTFESGWDIKICYSQYDSIELEIEYFTPN
jgi:hypothetical protein